MEEIWRLVDAGALHHNAGDRIWALEEKQHAETTVEYEHGKPGRAIEVLKSERAHARLVRRVDEHN